MYVLLAITLSIPGILISFTPVAKRSISTPAIASFTLWLSIIVTIANALVFFAGIKAGIAKDILLVLYNWGKVVWFLFAALLTASLFRIYRTYNKTTQSLVTYRILQLTILSASILCAFFFFFVTIGKARHLEEMKAFFAQSGYPVSLLYFNMITECIAAIGLLLYAKLRSGLYATIFLLLMMLAAVYTHIKNKDAIADSYDAFMQLLVLILLLVLHLINNKSRKQLQ